MKVAIDHHLKARAHLRATIHHRVVQAHPPIAKYNNQVAEIVKLMHKVEEIQLQSKSDKEI